MGEGESETEVAGLLLVAFFLTRIYNCDAYLQDSMNHVFAVSAFA
jgi:hypothetical protein